MSADSQMVSEEVDQGSIAPSPAPRRSVWRLLPWALILIPGVVAFLTVVWFINPRTATVETVQPADAVVLFAGASERLDTALDLFQRGVAPNLVLPNGSSIDDAEDLCNEGASGVFCPNTETIDTRGEAAAIGRLATENGWSRLIAVTSAYHVHRATFQLDQCFDGSIEAVTPSQGVDIDDGLSKVAHEWAGFLAALVFPPC